MTFNVNWSDDPVTQGGAASKKDGKPEKAAARVSRASAASLVPCMVCGKPPINEHYALCMEHWREVIKKGG